MTRKQALQLYFDTFSLYGRLSDAGVSCAKVVDYALEVERLYGLTQEEISTGVVSGESRGLTIT